MNDQKPDEAMSETTESFAESLESLRDEIDRIDDRVHALLIERASVVERIAAVKAGPASVSTGPRGAQGDDTLRGKAQEGKTQGDDTQGETPGSESPNAAENSRTEASGDADASGATGAPPIVVFRPAREALILRRLKQKHHGPFPLPVLLRIWREMISGYTRLQGSFSVAACVTEGDHLIWDIARDHFGSCTPVRVMRTPMPCVRAVMDREANIGVVPWPEDNDPSPWWGSLLSRDRKTPSIVARLPFIVSDRSGSGARALAIAQVPHEPSGDDRSFIAIELSEDISRSRLKDAMTRAGLVPTAFWSAASQSDRAQPLHLVEVQGFVTNNDSSLAKIEQSLENRVLRIAMIGGYAVPISLDE